MKKLKFLPLATFIIAAIILILILSSCNKQAPIVLDQDCNCGVVMAFYADTHEVIVYWKDTGLTTREPEDSTNYLSVGDKFCKSWGNYPTQ